jgi:predicted aspartyl protease
MGYSMYKVPTAMLVVAVASGCASNQPLTVIPIEIIQGNAIASARVGTDPIDLVIDTGGFGGVAIAPEELDRLKVDFTGTSIERTDAAGQSFVSREFVIPELSLGGNQFSSVRGFERTNSASGFAGGEPISVLGRGFLHGFTVVVDYPNGRIELYDAAVGSRVCGPKLSDMTRNEDGHLVLHIQTDGGEMVALMDTGATYSFVQSKLVLSRNLHTVDDMYLTDTLQIGARDFGPLEMVVLPVDGASDIDAFVGANFFSEHKVCFDYINMTVSFLTVK